LRTSLLVAATFLFFVSSLALSVVLTVSQVSVLPNRPDTTYELGRDFITGSRMTAAQLLLTGQDVDRVSVTFIVTTGSAYVRQAGLYDSNGNLLAASTAVCGFRGSGTHTETLPFSTPVPADSVAAVRTCIVRVFRVINCLEMPTCI